MQALSRYLNVSHAPINDLSTLEDDRVPGSCEWLTNSERFLDWQFSDDSPRFCWLTGQPATGKSVATAHVVGSLVDDTCSYFFCNSPFLQDIDVSLAQNSISPSLRGKLII